MKNIAIFLLMSVTYLCPLALFAAPPENKVPGPFTVVEDTDLKVTGLQVTDSDSDLKTVRLSMSDGNVEVKLVAGVTITSGANKSATLTLSGPQAGLNDTLKEFTVRGNDNYFGPATLKVVSTDSTPEEDKDVIQISITNGVPASQVCDWVNRPKNTYHYFGDYFDNFSVGPVASYSLVRYNLADKKSSFNAKSAGGGLSVRWYPSSHLKDFGVNSIKEVPRGCRAQTEDLMPDNKVVAPLSFAPTFYLSQGENEGEVETQLAFNLGMLNDLVTVGIGWNLSGKDAGEWFVIIGPSFGFSF